MQGTDRTLRPEYGVGGKQTHKDVVHPDGSVERVPVEGTGTAVGTAETPSTTSVTYPGDSDHVQEAEQAFLKAVAEGTLVPNVNINLLIPTEAAVLDELEEWLNRPSHIETVSPEGVRQPVILATSTKGLVPLVVVSHDVTWVEETVVEVVEASEPGGYL